MTQSPYVTVREAAQIIGVSEGKVMELSEQKKLMSYRIADQYLRFKRVEVQQLKSSGTIVSENVKFPYTFQERLRDFFAYNDFYVVSFVVIIALLAIIFFSK
ncbi:MAG: helix-turn-helix domain-containing protein [Candidatus Omnitrophica bacterium]|nr:helix-turn-helix domain-containing protein [Candidatus Omnitrophota bacterium]